MQVRIIEEHGHDPAQLVVTEEEKFRFLLTRVRYEPDTGDIYWLPKAGLNKREEAFNKRFANKRATSKSGNGYLQIGFAIDGKYVKAVPHRFAWFFVYGVVPSGVIDHIDGNKTNNKISNLRDVTQRLNMRNQIQRSNNSSGVRGIHWSKTKNKWIAQSMTLEGKHVHVGVFKCIEEAKIALGDFNKKNGYTERHGSGS